MKKILYILMLGLFTSCDSLLDVQPETIASFDNFFQTEQDLESTLYQLQDYMNSRLLDLTRQEPAGFIEDGDYRSQLYLWNPPEKMCIRDRYSLGIQGIFTLLRVYSYVFQFLISDQNNIILCGNMGLMEHIIFTTDSSITLAELLRGVRHEQLFIVADKHTVGFCDGLLEKADWSPLNVAVLDCGEENKSLAGVARVWSMRCV